MRDISARCRSQVKRKRGRRARSAHSSVLSLKMLDRIRFRFRRFRLFFFFYLFYISYFRFGSALLVCIRRRKCACFRRCKNDGSSFFSSFAVERLIFTCFRSAPGRAANLPTPISEWQSGTLIKIEQVIK